MNRSDVSALSDPPSAGYLLHMLFRTTHCVHRQFETKLSALHVPPYLTGPRLRFLNVVAQFQPIRMSELAAKLKIKARTVTQFVDALEQEEMLVRLADPADRRATFVKLTDKAQPLMSQAAEAMSAASEEILAAFPPEKRGLLVELLHELAAVQGTNDDLETS